MGSNFQFLRIVAGVAALSLSVVACQGGRSGPAGYVPASSAVSAPQTGSDVRADHKAVIVSSCGDRVHIVLLAIVDCKFRERGYGNGTFTLDDHTNGLILISPTTGTRKTKFTITGLVVGKGFFTVKDTRGNHLKVRVKITL